MYAQQQQKQQQHNNNSKNTTTATAPPQQQSASPKVANPVTFQVLAYQYLPGTHLQVTHVL